MTRRTSSARFVLVAAFVLLALMLVPIALADKGGGGHSSTSGGGGGHKGGGGSSTSSTLTLVLSTDRNGDGDVSWDDTITYDVSTTATSSPQVSTDCYQNGVLVLHANAAFYDGNPFAYMDYLQLVSGAWTGGAADCSAVMYYSSGKKTVTLATLDFQVDAY